MPTCFDCGAEVTGYWDTTPIDLPGKGNVLLGIPDKEGICSECSDKRGTEIKRKNHEWYTSESYLKAQAARDANHAIWDTYNKAISLAKEIRDEALSKLESGAKYGKQH